MMKANTTSKNNGQGEDEQDTNTTNHGETNNNNVDDDDSSGQEGKVQKFIDPSSGNYYYLDRSTGKTSWTKPTASIPGQIQIDNESRGADAAASFTTEDHTTLVQNEKMVEDLADLSSKATDAKTKLDALIKSTKTNDKIATKDHKALKSFAESNRNETSNKIHNIKQNATEQSRQQEEARFNSFRAYRKLGKKCMQVLNQYEKLQADRENGTDDSDSILGGIGRAVEQSIEIQTESRNIVDRNTEKDARRSKSRFFSSGS